MALARGAAKAMLTPTVLAMLALLTVGCSSGQPPSGQPVSPVTEAEARAMSENMLAAFNSGDYAAWSRDWSQAMKDGIPESTFQALRSDTMAMGGRFVAIESIVSRPGQNAGVTRWESTCTFEKGRYVLVIAFKEGSKLIEGSTLALAP